MKTTEVFVEQVLIGLLVILNFGLIFSQDIGSQFKRDFQTGAAVVAVAYLVGIVFDRFADTLLEDIERHNRLRFALRGKNPSFTKDPFPEDEYRMRVLQNHEAFAYSNYIRTRMRLSRAMAILIPGLSVSLLLRVTRPTNAARASAVALTAAIYGGALLLQLIRGLRVRKKNISTNERTALATLWYKPPRTDDRCELRRYRFRSTCWFAVREPSAWAFVLLTALALTLAIGANPPSCDQTLAFALFPNRLAMLAVPVLSIVLTLLTGWTWWRITETFMAFLRDFSRVTSKSP